MKMENRVVALVVLAVALGHCGALADQKVETFDRFDIGQSWLPGSTVDGWGNLETEPFGTAGIVAVDAEGGKALRLSDSTGRVVRAEWNAAFNHQSMPHQFLRADIRFAAEAAEMDNVRATLHYQSQNVWWPEGGVSLSVAYGAPSATFTVKQGDKQYVSVDIPGGKRLWFDTWYTVEMEFDFGELQARARLAPRDEASWPWTEWQKIASQIPASVRVEANGLAEFDNLVLGDEAADGPTATQPTEQGFRPVPAHSVDAAEGVSIHRVSPHFKVYPDDRIEAMETPLPVVELCRGEYEPFQIVLQADRNLAKVQVAFGDLPAGVTATSQPQGLVNIKKSPVRTGPTPDPLLNEPAMDIPAGENRAFWITVRADREAAAGEFAVPVTVTADGREIGRFIQPVRIYDFPMPKMPHLACIVEFRPWNDNEAYKGLFGWPIERQYALYRRYSRWYTDRRMQPGSLFPWFSVTQDDQGNWGVAHPEWIEQTYPRYWEEFPGAFQVAWVRNLMIGHGSSYTPVAEAKNVEEIRQTWRLFLAMHRDHGWPIDRYMWYLGDEPLNPGIDQKRDQNVPILNDWVAAVRPELGSIPVFASAWPFDRDLLPSIDIWSMLPYGDPQSNIERMPLKEARAYGKAVGLTLDGSTNLVMDREAINYRLNPWHGWYAGVPMIEYWNNMWWQMTPWDPAADWFSPEWIFPGDGNLNYPPPSEDQVITSIRAELLREGMEDYEYLWLLRHAAYTIRTGGHGPNENELLRRIDMLLYDAQQWVARGTVRRAESDYILLACNLQVDRLPWLAYKLDRLRRAMARTLEEAYRKGYVKDEAIDTGHAPPNRWFAYE